MAAGVFCASSTGLIVSKRSESSMVQYNGFRAAAETVQMESLGFRTRAFSFVSTNARCRRIRAMASPTVSASRRETDPKKRIVITGMGLVSAFGSDVDMFYNKLLDGVSGIIPIDRFDASEYSVRFAGQIPNFSSQGYIDGKNDRRLDDCWRYSLVAGKRALDDANLGKDVLDAMDKSRIGVLVGTSIAGISVFGTGIETLVHKGYKKLSPFFIPFIKALFGS